MAITVETLQAPVAIPASITMGAQVGTRNKTVGWYTPTMDAVDPAVRDLFEKYSHLESNKVIPHILEFRDKAWDIFPYPCIGQIRFIDLSLSRGPAYSRVLKALQSGSTLLDIGCCVAQDLRKLVHDGAPAGRLWGAELEAPFINMGYDLFRDKDTFGAHFMVADIYDMSEDRPLKQLEGKMDMIHVGLFLHLFDWEGQVKACERIVQILKQEPGVLVVGQQMGTTTPGVVNHGHRILFKHDDKSFERLWEEVGENTGTRWTVKAFLDEGLGIKEGKRAWDDDKARRLVFEVERVE